jgi:hypothetical protein
MVLYCLFIDMPGPPGAVVDRDLMEQSEEVKAKALEENKLILE